MGRMEGLRWCVRPRLVREHLPLGRVGHVNVTLCQNPIFTDRRFSAGKTQRVHNLLNKKTDYSLLSTHLWPQLQMPNTPVFPSQATQSIFLLLMGGGGSGFP